MILRSLLDVNALIALLDPDHIFHGRMLAWWRSSLQNGWASCPLTENGFIRITMQTGMRL
jgi:predicted nucleic acid-binding protein